MKYEIEDKQLIAQNSKLQLYSIGLEDFNNVKVLSDPISSILYNCTVYTKQMIRISNAFIFISLICKCSFVAFWFTIILTNTLEFERSKATIN